MRLAAGSTNVSASAAASTARARSRAGELLATNAVAPASSASAAAFAAAPPARRLLACEIVADKAQTLAEVWPLIAFMFVEPGPDEAAWKRVHGAQALQERWLNNGTDLRDPSRRSVPLE